MWKSKKISTMIAGASQELCSRPPPPSQGCVHKLGNTAMYALLRLIRLNVSVKTVQFLIFILPRYKYILYCRTRICVNKKSSCPRCNTISSRVHNTSELLLYWRKNNSGVSHLDWRALTRDVIDVFKRKIRTFMIYMYMYTRAFTLFYYFIFITIIRSFVTDLIRKQLCSEKKNNF